MSKNYIQKFDKQAEKYERMRHHNLMKKYRPLIFRDAEGEVLECAIGVGNNFLYYDNVEAVTGVDFSSEMLKFAKQEAAKYPFRTELMEADIETLHFEADSFDTIVSSLSFCGYEHPVKVLNQLSVWCRPGGKILLMEHGISRKKPLSAVQKLIDPLSLKVVGCHQNRNIEAVVKQSNLKIERIERFALGCVYLIWASPGH